MDKNGKIALISTLFVVSLLAAGMVAAAKGSGGKKIAECSDGIDNDSDGLVDYPADPGCISTGDNSELDGSPSLPPSPVQPLPP